MSEKFIPNITTELRKDIVKVPEIIDEASGIIIFGKKLNLLFLRQILRLFAIQMQML